MTGRRSARNFSLGIRGGSGVVRQSDVKQVKVSVRAPWDRAKMISFSVVHDGLGLKTTDARGIRTVDAQLPGCLNVSLENGKKKEE